MVWLSSGFWDDQKPSRRRMKGDPVSTESRYRHPELSLVSLVHPIDAEGMTLPGGARGIVVHVFPDEKAYIVEFEEPVHAVVTVEAGSIAK
jgi:hypothetical protein